MKYVELEIIGLSTGLAQRGNYTLYLGEKGGQLKLPIVIGHFEAQSIALVIEKIKTQRPMTHDLFLSFAEAFGLKLREVVICRLHEGVFYSKLVCESEKSIQEIDARTSDAISLALRFGCPIYVLPEILSEAGAYLVETDLEQPERPPEDDEALSPQKKEENFGVKTIEELKGLLDEAIQVEDYDKAALIRDEIKRRKKK